MVLETTTSFSKNEDKQQNDTSDKKEENTQDKTEDTTQNDKEDDKKTNIELPIIPVN